MKRTGKEEPAKCEKTATHRTKAVRGKRFEPPTSAGASHATDDRLHLLINEFDELFKEVDVLGARDLLHATHQLTPALDQFDAGVHAEFHQRPAGRLQFQ